MSSSLTPLEEPLQIVADLGNSRLKWAQVDLDGTLLSSVSLPLVDSSAWESQWETWNSGNAKASRWAISSVNPPVASLLERFLERRKVSQQVWFRSAADVPVVHSLGAIETAGADRALAVLAAQGRFLVQASGHFVVVLCGTAVTVERISREGVWQGGAITMGLGMAAKALHVQTAQLPQIASHGEPPGWGSSTLPALEAGVYWGVVGGVRELLSIQAAESPLDRVVWSGGDALSLSRSICWPNSQVVPNLVLLGLADLVFGQRR